MLNIEVSKQRGGFTLEVAIAAPTPGVVALFGRSGCGKTTLANIIAGLLAADTARIQIDEMVLDDSGRGRHVPAQQRRIGYVFQDARLFPHLSVLTNLQYGQRRAPQPQRIPSDAVVELLGLQALLARRPHQLSGGERQRVALGRALLSQPRLLLLDEPLASLDVARREEVLPYLERLRDEFAVPMVYVSHQFDEVLRLATHVVLLADGRVITQGDVASVSLHPQLRAIVGPDALGSVLSGVVESTDAATGLSGVRIGTDVLRVAQPNLRVGAAMRVQLLARDVIVAVQPPQGLSVRNVLTGTVAQLDQEADDTDLIHIDIAGGTVLARVTHAASAELALRPGLPVWVLVKAVSIRDHAFTSRTTSGRPP
jgi:molybdate transport system ATP-binding protein